METLKKLEPSIEEWHLERIEVHIKKYQKNPSIEQFKTMFFCLATINKQITKCNG